MSSEKDYVASGNHPSVALSKMKTLREKCTLCDVTLKIGDKEIPAHKVVLAASSPYFEFMFTGKVTERTKQCIEIKGFCPDAFLTVINFIYSGYLVMNEKTMLDVLEVVDYLKISNAKQRCFKYVQERIKLSNCAKIRDIAKKYYFTELEAKVNSFIESNFAEFISTDGFFELPAEEVKSLITQDSSYTDVSLYQKAICDWVDYEKSSREKLKEDLLGSLNVHIRNMAENGFHVSNMFLKRRIYVLNRDALPSTVYSFDIENRQWHCVRDKPQFECLAPLFHDNSVYIIGKGQCGRLNMEVSEWELKKIPFSNDYNAACSVQNGIYIIAKTPSKQTFIYNTETEALYPEPELIRNRSSPGVAFSENCVYVFGGVDPSAECRDLRTKIWRSISQPPTSTDECSATSFNNRIYLTSSSSGKFYEFDPRNGVWAPKVEIPKTEKSTFTLGSTDEAIYCSNGKSYFRYQMGNNTWSSLGCTSTFSSFVCVYPQEKMK